MFSLKCLKLRKEKNVQNFLFQMTFLRQPLTKELWHRGRSGPKNMEKKHAELTGWYSGLSMHFQFLQKSKRIRPFLSFTKAWHFHPDQFPLESHRPSLSFHVQSIKNFSQLCFLCIQNPNIFHHSHSKYSQQPAWNPVCILPTLQEPLHHLILEFVTF